MRLRRYAGLLAGALVAGTMSIPMLASSASAAPSTVSVSRDFACSYGDFSLPYVVTTSVTADGAAVTATLNDMPATGFPTGLKVAGFEAEIGLDLDGESVELAGENTYPTNISGGGTGVTVQLPMPALAGTRTATAALTAGTIDSLDLVMKAGFQFSPAVPVTITDNPLTCVAGAVQTSTTLAATSPSAGVVQLAATVAPTAEGTVEFQEAGATVGTQTVAGTGASLNLSGVSAGDHSYTAKFVPTDAAEFAASTSAVVKVTVAASGPSAACVTAQDSVKSALTAVTKAKAAVKKAKAKIKKAKTTVKKAKGKKKQKAAKKLKKVKASAKKVSKTLGAATKKHAAAAAAAKKVC
ncbi:Ig-like domain-containing protein [Nocardioides pantholopis]|uniref:Ig-like domain-containing protein n=1 Tax=Nocardioides pantholopis TaxID=2483798 RepID=UPI000F07F15A|nr:Ig-like domain-containing protein [Nocardioides pantholopis]